MSDSFDSEIKKRMALFMDQVRKLKTYGEQDDPVPKGRGGCWEWIGAKQRSTHLQRGERARYGQFYVGELLAPTRKSANFSVVAHRAAYKLFVDPNFDLSTKNSRRHIDHRCGKKDCVNPTHLKVKSAYENNLSKPGSPLRALDQLEDEFPEARKHIEAIRKIARARYNLAE